PGGYRRVGGDGRLWFENFKNEGWGVLPFQPPDADVVEVSHNSYLLQRYMFSGDARFGTRLRAYSQLQSSIINGRTGGPRPIIDSDELDVHQAWVDVNFLLNRQKAPAITLRVGRQAMLFGAGRLVA